MAFNRLIDTRTIGFGELMSNGNRYQVPDFQRDYAWNSESWEDLWEDIVRSHETKEPHFMGAIVTQAVPTSPLISIIDGQQRLATLSIFVIAVIQSLQTLVENAMEPDANRERQEILRRTFLGDRDPGSLRYASKLSLNLNDNGFYQDNLVNLRKPKNIYALTSSEQLLWSAFDYFFQQIQSYAERAQSGADLADLLSNTIAKRLLFIQIDIEDETDAYVLFETLNARGTALSQADLLKNYLFSLLSGPDDRIAGQREWQRIVRTVGMEAVPNLLKFLLCLTDGRVRDNRLFKLVRNRIDTAQQAFTLLEKLDTYSNLFAALRNPDDNFWNLYSNKSSLVEHVEEIALFGVDQIYPAIFAAYQKFNESDFAKLLKLLSVIVFRHSVVGNLNPNELYVNCSKLATQIHGGVVTTPRAAFRTIAPLYVNDDKFQQEFSTLSISTKRQKAVVQYILNKLEEDATERKTIANSFSVEHILPQSPSEQWRQTFKGDVDSVIYRLGNMTPLEPTLNRKIGSEPYTIKQAAYQNSAYAITRQIQFEDWTSRSISARQMAMARRAIHIWRLDYV